MPDGPPTLVDEARAKGVQDLRTLDALRAIRRALFVPARYAASAELDVPLPIGHAQVTTQPSLVAAMVASLGLTGTEGVLEIGSGYGYQTALLAHLARFVWSIEWWPDLASAARANLAAAGVANVEVVAGDGTLGMPEHAPYDAIVVSAAFPSVPTPLVAQLARAGRLVQPIGRGGGEEVVVFEARGGALRRLDLVAYASFVPLLGEHGFPAPRGGEPPG